MATPVKRNTRLGWTVSVFIHAILFLVFLSNSMKQKPNYSLMSVQVDFGNTHSNIDNVNPSGPQMDSKEIDENQEKVTELEPEEVSAKSKEVVTQDKAPIALPTEDTKTQNELAKKPKKPKKTKPKLSSLLKKTLRNIKKNNKGQDKINVEKTTEGELILNKGRNYGKGNATNSSTGTGTDKSMGNYRLGDRSPINTPQPVYDCKDQGIVAVRIIVNSNGNVILAEPGVQGSSTLSACLMKRAKEAAYNTTWTTGEHLPDRQEGLIIYEFSIIK